MIRHAALWIGLLSATNAAAETIVPSRTIPAGQIIEMQDLQRRDGDLPGVASDPAQVAGLEARVALYAGRPILLTAVGAPAVIERNQIVALIFTGGGVHISTEGRALDRGGPGDVIRVMNMTSRNTVSARAGSDGAAYVSQQGF